jgi:hypothetical protein
MRPLPDPILFPRRRIFQRISAYRMIDHDRSPTGKERLSGKLSIAAAGLSDRLKRREESYKSGQEGGATSGCIAAAPRRNLTVSH